MDYFQYNHPFERAACFYAIITDNFECFQYFNFEINFLKIKNHLQKAGVKSAKIENIIF